jgi:hypothetical protein
MLEAFRYRQYHIHTARVASEKYICSIVNLGKAKPMTEDSLTDKVTRVPGEFESETAAVEAGKAYIDTLEQTADAPHR